MGDSVSLSPAILGASTTCGQAILGDFVTSKTCLEVVQIKQRSQRNTMNEGKERLVVVEKKMISTNIKTKTCKSHGNQETSRTST